MRWVADTHATLDWAEVRDGLPVNPPGAFLAEGDVQMDNLEILNWTADEGWFEFRPRLRDNVQQVPRTRVRMALADEAPELDDDYELDCD